MAACSEYEALGIELLPSMEIVTHPVIIYNIDGK